MDTLLTSSGSAEPGPGPRSLDSRTRAGLETLLLKCWRKNPEKKTLRFFSDEGCKRRLERC